MTCVSIWERHMAPDQYILMSGPYVDAYDYVILVPKGYEKFPWNVDVGQTIPWLGTVMFKNQELRGQVLWVQKTS